MQNSTLQDWQNISTVYLALVIEKGAKGRIPAMAICPVVRCNQNLLRLNYGGVINPKKYILMSTKPVSEYYQQDQYRIYEDGGHICISFDNDGPFKRYIEFAGKSFDKYVKRYHLR